MGGNGGDTGGSDDQQVARPGHILPALTFPAKVVEVVVEVIAGHWGAVGRSSLKQSRGGAGVLMVPILAEQQYLPELGAGAGEAGAMKRMKAEAGGSLCDACCSNLVKPCNGCNSPTVR
jgi:hypothetical protein